MELQRLSIHQTMGQIGVDTRPGSQTIQSSPGEQRIEQPDADMQIQSPPGQLEVDQSAAWDALGMGSTFEWSSRIYSQSKQVLLQAIARTASEGERMADLLSAGNPIAQIAKENAMDGGFPDVSYTGEPGYMNVKVNYQAQDPSIRITPRSAVISYTPHTPDIQYQPGSVSIYMRQKNSIDIQVSRYDWYS